MPLRAPKDGAVAPSPGTPGTPGNKGRPPRPQAPVAFPRRQMPPGSNKHSARFRVDRRSAPPRTPVATPPAEPAAEVFEEEEFPEESMPGAEVPGTLEDEAEE